jgi:hypothetical protein
MMDAMEEGNVNSIIQNKNSLSRFAAQGMKDLDTVRTFRKDASLSAACQSVLAFYKKEADTKVPVLVKYYTAKEKLEKVKKLVNPNDPSKNTKEAVDQYNAAVNEFNAAVAKYNATNQELGEQRKKVISKWQNTRNQFLAKHAP